MNPYQPPVALSERRSPWVWLLRAMIALMAVAVMVVGCFVSWWMGRFAGNEEIYGNLYTTQTLEIQPILDKHPAFSRLKVKAISGSTVQIFGTVNSREDLDLLKREIKEQIGGELAEDYTRPVDILDESPQ